MSGRRWCPGVFDPMPSGDGLLVRIKPPGMRIPAAAAMRLADAASRYGNGMIELTSRGNVQIRGVSQAGIAPLAAAMIGAGLAAADPERERRRLVVCSPLAGDDPTLALGTADIAAEIERGLIAERSFAALPAKFSIVVDGGGVLPLDAMRADIRVRAVANEFRVSLNGGDGVVVRSPAMAASCALGLAREYSNKVALLRVPDRPELKAKRVRCDPPPPRAGEGCGGGGSPVGFIRYPGRRRGAFGVGVAFGAMDATALRAVAEIAGRFGDGMLRTSPWRAILIGGVAESAAAALAGVARQGGFIVEPDDPRRRVVACAGRPACVSAAVPARADAERLAGLLGGFRGTLHISGCRKGCAHRGRADVTLVGENGFYSLVRGGTVQDPPEASHLTIAEAAARLQHEAAA